MTLEAEVGVRQGVESQEYGQPLKARKGEETVSFLEPITDPFWMPDLQTSR